MKNFRPDPEYGIEWYHVLGAAILGLGVVALLASPKIAGVILLAIIGYALWHKVIDSH